MLGFVMYFFVFLNGYLFSKLIKRQASFLERLNLSFATGFILSAPVFFLLALIARFHNWSTLASLGAETIVLATFIRYKKIKLSPNIKTVNLPPGQSLGMYNLIKYPIIFFILLSLYTAALPSQDWDALAYHLYNAKIISLNNGLPLSGVYDYRWFIPLSAELFWASIWTMDTSMLPVYLFPAIIGILVSSALYLIIKKLYGIKEALLGALIFYSTPFFFRHTVTNYVDLFLGYFVILGFFYLLDGKRKDRYIAALLFGFSAWIKVTGVLSILFFTAYLLWKKDKETLRLVSFSIIVAAPWFVKNMLLFGTPLADLQQGIGNTSLDNVPNLINVHFLKDWLFWWVSDVYNGNDYIAYIHRGIGIFLPFFLAYSLLFLDKKYDVLAAALVWVSFAEIFSFVKTGTVPITLAILRFALPGLLLLVVPASKGAYSFLEDVRQQSKTIYRIASLFLILAMIFPAFAYTAREAGATYIKTKSFFASEDEFYAARSSDFYELKKYLPEKEYSINVRTHYEYAPYILKQRRCEAPPDLPVNELTKKYNCTYFAIPLKETMQCTALGESEKYQLYKCS